MSYTLKASVLTASALFLSACESGAFQSDQDNAYFSTHNSWFVTGVITNSRDLKMMRPDCLPIIISEQDSQDGADSIVFYHNDDVPALLLNLGVTRPEDLIGKQINVKDEHGSIIAPIFKVGRAYQESDSADSYS